MVTVALRAVFQYGDNVEATQKKKKKSFVVNQKHAE